MAVPFRRKSSSSTRDGRGPKNWAFQKRSCSARPLIKCYNCQGLKILHLACSHCLTYKKLSFQNFTKQQPVK